MEGELIFSDCIWYARDRNNTITEKRPAVGRELGREIGREGGKEIGREGGREIGREGGSEVER